MSTIHQSGSAKWKKTRKKHFNCLRSLDNCPQKKGVVSKVRVVSPKKPNSARRKVARVRLSNNLFITAKIRGQGHNLQSYSTVLICGGRANDLPGVRYNVIKGVLDFNWKEDYRRSKSRSKYGISLEDFLQYA